MESSAASSSGPLQKERRAPSWSLSVFTPLIRFIWVAIVLVTVLSEVVPLPLLPRLSFYSYSVAKAILFSVIGYLTPLTFWRFNALNRGIIFAAGSAVLVEGSQALIQHGHSFHWYELVVKLALILFGFALALDARYERVISLGLLRIRLVGEHLEK